MGANIPPSANSSDSSVTGTCMHPEERDIFAHVSEPLWGLMMKSKELACQSKLIT